MQDSPQHARSAPLPLGPYAPTFNISVGGARDAILGMSVDKVPPHIVRDILKGGSAVCNAAGIPIASGHSIDALRPRRHRHLPHQGCAPQCRRQGGRRADPHQGAWCRHLFRGPEEGRAQSRRLRRDDRIDDAAQPRRNEPGAGRSGARHHRCDRFRLARACPGDGAGLEAFPGHSSGRSAAPDRRRRVGAAGSGDRGIGPELAKLWRSRTFAGGSSRLAQTASHRSADIGRAADRLLVRSRR